MTSVWAQCDLREAMVNYEDILRRIEEEAGRIRRVLALNLHKLATEGTVVTQNPMFSVVNLAAHVNTASRWDGRVHERLDVAYEAEKVGAL